MLGAIIGDIAGSRYEFAGNRDPSVPLFANGCDFTDDSIMTIATAHAILYGGNYRDSYVKLGRFFPNPMGGYGGRFGWWLREPDPQPYNSWGNGSAMRVAPVGWAFDCLEETLVEAEKSAAVSHNHLEGIKGAQATAAAIWLARHGKSKLEIERFIADRFGYDISKSIPDLRRTYEFNESCQGTVPQALTAFLQSESFEESIRNAISLGGDADTVACITGGIAEAFYQELPSDMVATARKILAPNLLEIVDTFAAKYRRS